MSALSELVRTLRAERVLSALDEQLARSLCTLAAETDEQVGLAIALLSRHVAAGHVCLPLRELSQPALLLGAELAPLAIDAWPALGTWIEAVKRSPLCCAGEPTSPLVIDQAERLYFRRHYACEQSLASLLRARAARIVPTQEARVSARLQQHFGASDGTDLQRRAAELATRRALCVISGGPGTGKTSTVVRILAVVVEEALASGAMAPRIALAAPTGKAAVRLQSAVLSAKQRLECEPEVRAAIPETASTIHRLLAQAAQRDRSEVSVQAELLPVDLLLVDEASMVNLELMAQLMAALPEQASVILLGDRDQLASVEAGAVLGDICAVVENARADNDLAQCIVQLTRSYRYGANSGIGQLARAVQAGDAQRALAILDDPQYLDVSLCEDTGAALLDPAGPLASDVLAGYRPYLGSLRESPAQALRLFDGFRVLCAHRQGARGVVALNREIARLLARADLIGLSDGQFLGRPIMVTENDYRTQLWNGDVGVIASEAGERFAYFLGADGAQRRLGIGRLPPHESAFALSVHKSQGSEVEVVSLVLPAEPSRILSRELVYTALTRAKQRVVIHGSRQVLTSAITQAVSRNTGLQDLLR